MIENVKRHPIEGVRSDALKHLRSSITQLKQLNLDLGLVAQFSLVIDTNAVIKELLWLTQKRRNPGARSGLMETVESETIKLYGPPQLFDEVQRKIPIVAADRNADESQMFAHWDHFKKRIALAMPDPTLTAHLKNGIDPDDAEFVALQKTIGATGVLSNDAHIPLMGGTPITIDCVFLLRDYSRSTAIEMSIKVAGTHMLIASIAGVKVACHATRSLAHAYRRLPDWIKVTLIVGAFMALSNQKIRSQAAATLRSLANGISNASPKAVELVADAATIAYENRERAKSNLALALSEIGRVIERTI
ncbi:hypothetical protein ACN9MY_06225 [Pseudoduganella sp. R-31]|uniref:hypothetical protein n=1 Tax=Pseudoduganella sp. R-31 TaxID=3404060 RepID=UPI003CEE3D77